MSEAIETLVEADAGAGAADTVAFLRDVRLFREFSAADLEDLAASVRERRLTRGQVLLHEGELGREMFFIRRGTVIISKAVTARVEEVLARMGPGEFIGEMSLLDAAPRSATVRAESDVLLLALDRQHLQRFLAASPRVAAIFFRAYGEAVVQRLRSSDNLVTEVARWGLEATGLELPAVESTGSIN